MATFTERVLVLCKTYPSPSSNYTETSCVAGVTEAGKLIRLFPVPFRLIADEQQFHKWQWMTVVVEKARNDHRPESHRVFVDTIRCDPEPLKAGKAGWPIRMQALRNVPVHTDFAAVEAARQTQGATLALLRPNRILSLEIRPTKNPEWTQEELAKLQQVDQPGLFDSEEDRKSLRLLEKIPFDFYYHYECLVDGEARVYQHKLVDWEVGALYRRLRREYGAAGWEEPFRQKYERDLPALDVHLLLGTIHRWVDKWLVVSVFGPPRPQPESSNQTALF